MNELCLIDYLLILQYAVMEILGWLEVDTQLKVVWSFVSVVCGALFVAISGVLKMLL